MELTNQINEICNTSKNMSILEVRIQIEHIDRLIDELNCKKQELQNKITPIIEKNKKVSDKLKLYFNIQLKNNISLIHYLPGIKFNLPIYQDINLVPIMTYAVVKKNQHSSNNSFIIYKYGTKPSEVVSCNPIKIIKDSKTNIKTLCCNNVFNCSFRDKCRFYHDPIIAPHPINHHSNTQHFHKTYMVPKNNLFGDCDLLYQQLRQMNFEQVRTLARYCANMNLIISLLCNR
jgi:hypothetical protein